MSDYCYGFPIFHRVEAQAELMDRMLQHARITRLELIRRDSGASWYEARTRCLECHLDRECRAWLAAHMAEPDADLPEFCPNVRVLRASQ